MSRGIGSHVVLRKLLLGLTGLSCLLVVLRQAPAEVQCTLGEGVGMVQDLLLLLVGATCQRQCLLFWAVWGGRFPLG